MQGLFIQQNIFIRKVEPCPWNKWEYKKWAAVIILSEFYDLRTTEKVQEHMQTW